MKTIDEVMAAIGSVNDFAAIDQLSRIIWIGLAKATFSESQAQALSDSLEARKAILKAKATNPASGLPRGLQGRSKHCRTPDRQRSLERRRGLAASGVLPARLAYHFTTGEQAVLTIVGTVCKAGGRCVLPIDAIAAKAGVSRTTVQNALRAAKRLGFISVQERRFRGRASDFNVLQVVSPEWIMWLRLGGTAQRGGDRVQKNKPDQYKDSKYDGYKIKNGIVGVQKMKQSTHAHQSDGFRGRPPNENCA